MAWIDTKQKKSGPRYYVCWRARDPRHPSKKKIFRSSSYRNIEEAQSALKVKEQEEAATPPPNPPISLQVVEPLRKKDISLEDRADLYRDNRKVRFTAFAFRKRKAMADGQVKPYGHWLAGWRDEFGERHSKAGFVNRETAKVFAQKQLELVQQRVSGVFASDGADKLVFEALEAFCSRPADRRAPICEETHVLNRRNIEPYLAFCKIKTVDRLTKDSIERWWTELKSTGRDLGGQGFNLKIIKAFCNFCRKKGWLRKDLFDDIAIPRGTSKGTYLLPFQRQKLLNEIDPRYRELDQFWCRTAQFGLYSCLRIGQVFNVDWSQFNPETGKLKVLPWKRQKERTIRLHPKAIQAMGEPKNDGKVFDRWPTIAAMRESFMKRMKRLGMKGIRFHDTGHTMISRLFELGYSPAEVREYTGKSWTTIQQYSHVYKKHLEEKIVTFDYPKHAHTTARQQVVG